LFFKLSLIYLCANYHDMFFAVTLYSRMNPIWSSTFSVTTHQPLELFKPSKHAQSLVVLALDWPSRFSG